MIAKFLLLYFLTLIDFVWSDVTFKQDSTDHCDVCCQDAHQDLIQRSHASGRHLETAHEESSASEDHSTEESHSSSAEGHSTSESHSSASEDHSSEESHSSTADSDHSETHASQSSTHDDTHSSTSVGHSSGSAHGSASGSASGHSSAHGQWWEEEYEYTHIEAWVIVGLLLLTMLFDEIHHKTEEIAGRHGHDGLMKHFMDHTQKVHTTNMWEELHARFSGELAVLGFLALTVWICNQGQLFDKLAEVDYSAEILMPPTGSDYLHTIEAVHMHIFIAMCFYYYFVGMVIVIATKLIHKSVDANYIIKRDYQRGTIQEEGEHVYYKKKDRFFRMFFQLRSLYFASLEQWRGGWPFLDEHLEMICQCMVQNPNNDDIQSSESFKQMGMPSMLRKWFPFDLYLIVNYRHTIDGLLEISWMTWLEIIVVLLFTAIYQQATLTHMPVKLIMFIISQLSIFAMIVLVLFQWWSAKKKVKSFFRKELNKQVWVHNAHPVRVMVRLLQCSLFFSTYKCSSVIANKYKWKDNPGECWAYIIIVAVAGIFEGLLVGIFLPLYSTLCSTGPYMQQQHVLRLVAIVKVYCESNDVRLRALVENIEEFDEVVAETEEENLEAKERQENGENGENGEKGPQTHM